ncbi:MAG: OsmC family protein [Bacteroidetes bacterium]|nr:OsmC family protein [Bacteroidota bacterium]
MNTQHHYQVKVNWVSDRKGIVSSEVLPTTIEVATPPDFPKGMAGIWSPEHFLVAAANSCLMTTFLAIAENSKLEFQSFECNAVGVLDKVDGKLMVAEIILHPTVVVADEPTAERALRIIEKSEAACLISNSLKSKMVLQSKVVVKH